MTGYRSTGNSNSRQAQQRQAVAGALDRQKVFISAMRFRSDEEPRFRVIVSNEAYLVRQRSLDMLLSGATPQELGLEPIYGESSD